MRHRLDSGTITSRTPQRPDGDPARPLPPNCSQSSGPHRPFVQYRQYGARQPLSPQQSYGGCRVGLMGPPRPVARPPRSASGVPIRPNDLLRCDRGSHMSRPMSSTAAASSPLSSLLYQQRSVPESAASRCAVTEPGHRRARLRAHRRTPHQGEKGIARPPADAHDQCSSSRTSLRWLATSGAILHPVDSELSE